MGSEGQTTKQIEGKVAQVLHKYGETDLLDELPARYTGKGEFKEESYRDLARRVNRRIVESVIRQNLDLMEVPDAFRNQIIDYYLIQRSSLDPKNSEWTERDLQEMEEFLRERDFPVEEVEEDIVSYNSVRWYLQEVAAIPSQSPDGETGVARIMKAARGTKKYVRQVMKDPVEGAVGRDCFKIKSPDVSVSIQIRCEDCGEMYTTGEVQRGAKCACFREDS